MSAIIGPNPAAHPTRLLSRAQPASGRPRSGQAVRLDERSCCCSAPPLVRVILVLDDPSAHAVDILLCGHHYRGSHEALSRLGALVFDRSGYLLPWDCNPVHFGFAADPIVVR